MNNTPQTPQTSDEGPWYKQPWAWFVLTPLITIMIVWIPFMTIIVKDADDEVIDNYYKEGRMINMRVDEDKAARALGLAGELAFDMQVGDVVLNMQTSKPDYTWPAQLELHLDHPMESDLDFTIVLHQVREGRYQGELHAPLQHHWYLRLLPVAKAGQGESAAPWRVVSAVNFDESSQLSFGFAE